MITFHLSIISRPTETNEESYFPVPLLYRSIRSPVAVGKAEVVSPNGFLLVTCLSIEGSL